MRPAKAEGNEAGHGHNRTPFERFQKFVRAVVAVPKRELPAQERVYQRAKKKQKRKPR